MFEYAERTPARTWSEEPKGSISDDREIRTAIGNEDSRRDNATNGSRPTASRYQRSGQAFNKLNRTGTAVAREQIHSAATDGISFQKSS